MRKDLITFLAGAEGPVRIGQRLPPCSRCRSPRDREDYAYCAECRREYAKEQQTRRGPRVMFHGRYPELAAFFILQKSKAEREGRPLEGLAASIRTLPEWPAIARECAAIRFPDVVGEGSADDSGQAQRSLPAAAQGGGGAG